MPCSNTFGTLNICWIFLSKFGGDGKYKLEKNGETQEKLCKEKQRIHFENDIYENAIERMLKQLGVWMRSARPHFSYEETDDVESQKFCILFVIFGVQASANGGRETPANKNQKKT